MVKLVSFNNAPRSYLRGAFNVDGQAGGADCGRYCSNIFLSIEQR